MADFPTLGLRFDLQEVFGGEAVLKRVRDLYVEIAQAKASAEGRSAPAAGADSAELAALQARIARYEQLAAVMAQAENGGVAAAKGAASQILAADAALQTKRVQTATQTGQQIAKAEALTAQQILRARQGLTQGLAQAAAGELKAEEQNAAQILALRQRLAAQQARSTAGTGTEIGISDGANNAVLTMQKKLNAQRAQLYAEDVAAQEAADAKKLAAVMAEAQAENDFIEKLRLRAAAGVATPAPQVALAKQTIVANNYGPGASAAVAEVEAVNQALADASKAEAGAKFIAELQALADAGVRLGPTTAAMKAIKAEQLGVAAAAGPLIEGMAKTEREMANLGGTSLRVREGLVLLRESMRGDFTRMAGSATLEAQALGLMDKILSPVGLGLIALAAAIGVVVFAMLKGQDEINKFNGALIATGNYAGLTASSYDAMARKIADSSGATIGSVRKIAEEFTASGKFSSLAIAEVTDAVANYSRITGKNAEEIAREYDGMKDHLIQWAVKHEDTYHDLTVQQLDHIALLIKEGKEAEAQAALLTDIDNESKRRLQEKTAEEIKQMGYLEDAMHGIILLASKFWDALLGLGRGKTLDEQISDQTQAVLAAQDKIQAALARGSANGRTPLSAAQTASMKAELQAQIADLSKLQGEKAAEDKKAADDAAAAQKRHDEIQKKYGDGKSHAHTRSTDGIQNQIAKTLAEVDGLNNQVDAILSHMGDPLADFTAQIEKARQAAEAAASHGPKSAFAKQAGDAAALKEEATLRLQIVEAASKQVAAEKQRQAQMAITAQGDRDAFAAMQAYYQGGTASLGDFLKAQDKANDALLAAKLRFNDYSLAIKFGVASVDQISAALVASGAETKAHADQIQQSTQAQLNETNAADRLSDSLKRQTDVQGRLTTAFKAYDDLLKQTRDLQGRAQLATADERAADAMVTQEQIFAVIIRSIAQGVNLTEQEARNIARQNDLLQIQQQYWANLAIQMKDAFEQTFIDTGKLDFKGLQDGMTKALRKALYDALLAKPIDIIVNAEVSLVNQITSQFIQPFADKLTSSLSGGLSGLFGGSGFGSGAPDFGGGLGAALQGLTGTGSDSLIGTMGDLDTSVQGLAKGLGSVTQGLGGAGGGLLGAIGGAFAGQQIGSTLGGVVAKALGINQGAGAQVGSGLGSIAGMIFGGPIGAAIGGVLGDLVGGLFDNKPTNGAAFGTLTRTSASYSSNSKTSQQSAQLAQTFGSDILGLEQSLTAAGIKTKNYVSGIDIGTRDVPMVSFSDGTKQRLGAVGDAAAAAAGAMKVLLQNATYQSDAQKKLVDSIIATTTNLDDLAKKLQEFAQAQDFLKGIDRSILKLQDPQGGALADLRDQQIARRQQAISYYQDGVISADQLVQLQAKLKTLEKLEIVQTISQFNNGLQDVTATLADFQAAQTKIIDYAKGLLVGQLSPLSPQDQLNTAANAFQTMLAKAKGGDKTSLDNITGAADTYLGQAHSFYASSSGYVSIFNQVEQALQALGTQAYPDQTAATTPDNAAVVQALADLQSEITKNNADLITAVTPAANDAATSKDIAGQTATLVSSLQDVQQTIAASTEAITGALSQSTATPLSLTTMMTGGKAA